MEVKHRKADIRKHVWDEMESKEITIFPRPVFGRISNFKGAHMEQGYRRDARKIAYTSSNEEYR